ncbi:MAG: hypothetical protein ACRD4I_16520, partial [Candidatus Angelobacter sp.]
YITNPETGKTEGQDPGTEPLRRFGKDGGTANQKAPGHAGQRNRHSYGSTNRGAPEFSQQKGKPPEPAAATTRQRDDQGRERNRILNELRWMGKNKKKPAA